MEIQQERTPTGHPDGLRFPSVPQNDLPLRQNFDDSKSLPHLQSLGLPTAPSTSLFANSLNSTSSHPGALSPTSHDGSYNRFRTYGELPPLRSPGTTDSGMSPDGRAHRAPSVMSLDDPETREAAETLSGLRNVGKYRLKNLRLRVYSLA
jgi:hypothetical protein